MSAMYQRVLRFSLPFVGALCAAVLLTPASARAQSGEAPTFTKDIAPILQRSCQKCHRPNSLAPMSLITYEEVRPWARSIKQRTGLRNRLGVMPPWYIEKDIGIQEFKDDWSLSDEEITAIATWVDAGAPRGNPADMPTPPPFIAIEYKERNDLERGIRSDTVGGLFVIHHSALTTMGPEDGPRDAYQWPVHEVGRNADVFDAEAGPVLRADSKLIFPSTHLHSNGTDTNARLEVGFKFHPKGYEPTKEVELLFFGNGPDIDILPMQADQRMDAYFTLPENTKISVYEPHMHAPGVRMCLEAVWGTPVETLNCSGYDHNWVRVYKYEDHAAPLLPKGTILHLTGYFDNSPTNPNVPDPRNWSGSGHRSVDNMFINLLQAIYMDDEEFAAEVALRERRLRVDGSTDIGCVVCGTSAADAPANAGGDQ